MDLGDHIGMESFIEMKSDLDSDVLCCRRGDRRLTFRREKKEREFPPPISMAENLRRYYTADGRLIIREEKASYLLARRSGGRLTLELVGVKSGGSDLNNSVSESNDGVFERREINVEGEFEKCEAEAVNDDVHEGNAEIESNVEGKCDDRTVMDGGDLISSVDRTAVVGGGKCYRYNSLGMFGLRAQAIRPVHI